MSNQKQVFPDDMRRAVDDYRRKSDLIVDTFVDSIKDTEPPDTIFHYTDGAGLLGILAAGSIRLTDIFGLNDPTELLHGVNHARTILAHEAQNGHPAGNLFAKQFDRIMDGALDKIATFFVACFSRNGDELGQWRAYGDNGHGFALGFDRSALEQAFAGPHNAAIPNNSTFPMTYDDVRLKGLQSDLARELIPLMSLPHDRRLPELVIREYMKELSMQLGLCVTRAAIFFKHQAYENEREYRFLQIREFNAPMHDVQHRARRTSLVRFIDFPWKHVAQDALRSIVIGPASDESAARAFIDKCIRIAGIQSNVVSVGKSDVPYRGFC